MADFTKALIIDDDTDLCMMLTSMVNMLVPQVKSAQTLRQGKQMVAEFKPDVIFLDNNLPDGHGLDAIEDIRQALPEAFIVFITAMDAHHDEALAKGADLFLAKPFTYNSIQSALGISATKVS